MLLKGPVPAPIALATIAGAFPIFRALFSGGNLALAALVGLVGAIIAYFVGAYLVRKMGLPVTASLSDVSASRKNAKSKKPE